MSTVKHTSVYALFTLFFVAMFVLAACAPIAPTMPVAPAAPQPEPGKLTVLDPMARPSPMMQGNGAAYMTVLNGLDTPVQLVSAASSVAETVELHETVDDSGVMRMVPQPDGFEIPAGGSVELKPGGKHVMLIGLLQPLEPGQEIEITLNFTGADPITVTTPVMEIDAAAPSVMSEDAHDHMDAAPAP